jgi:hypothetical protein
MTPVHVFFFRGLNTEGSDDAKLFVFNYGPIYRHVSQVLASKGVSLHPVLGMGTGPLDKVGSRALAFLENHEVWKQAGVPVHILGHSAGGLVARWLLENNHLRPNKIISFLTLASPHRGAQLAQICLDLPERNRGTHLLMRSIGYDIGGKRESFLDLTPKGVGRCFPENRSHSSSHSSQVGRRASIVCHAPRADWCAPLRALYKIKAFGDLSQPSDGFVERDSQPYADVVAEVRIDHMRQIGLFGESYRFARLCDIVADFFKRTQRSL